jgi:hypothetical protein
LEETEKKLRGVKQKLQGVSANISVIIQATHILNMEGICYKYLFKRLLKA